MGGCCRLYSGLSSEELKPNLSEIKARSFGGVILKKRQKVQRPLLPGKVHHVVFKSSKAKGKMSFSALLAREMTGAKKGNPFGKFWDGLVFTRVLMTRFEELRLKGYFTGNHIQKEVGYKQREEYLQHWNQFLYRLKKKRASVKAKKELEEELQQEIERLATS